jgi:hypothetical protein
MENGTINLIVENEQDETFIIEIPSSSIQSGVLREILREKVAKNKSNHFYFMYKNKKYTKNDLNETLNFSQGERINLVNTFSPESFTECHFHKNINLSEADKKVEALSGILHLCNLKNIARYIDLNKIKDNEIKEIMKDFKESIKLTGNPQQDIKETLSKKDGKNILTFINFLDKKIKYKDVKDLIYLIDTNQRNQIIDYWNILLEYQDLNKLLKS